MQQTSRSFEDRVDLALRRFEEFDQLGRFDDTEGAALEISTPAPISYALGWILANEVVQRRYAGSAIDVIPVYHPERGWDRFLLSRRVACVQRSQESANRFGMIPLSGEDGPGFAAADGTLQFSVGSLLRQDPAAAVEQLLDSIPEPALGPGEHERCWHSRAAAEYPLLYDVIVDLILDYPGLIAAREIFVDDEQVAGAFHPLYIHTGGQLAGLTYDWFAVESGDYLAYVRLHGRGAVHRTDRATWKSTGPLAGDPDRATLRANLIDWLRLDMNGHPGASDG